MTDELGINLSIQSWIVQDRCVVSCNALHFLDIPEKCYTDSRFLQSIFEIAPIEVLLYRNATGLARHSKLFVSRIDQVWKKVYHGSATGNITIPN